MNKFKSILKAFVVIAVIPILLIGGIAAVSFVAPLCFGGLSNPFFAFPATILMLPWGFLFAIVFFCGITLTPSFVITPTGNGGYATSSGTGRNGNGCSFIFNILKLVFLVPIALLIWVVISIIILFSSKLQNKINEVYIEFISYLKKWYKIGVIFFVIAPLIVLGFNALENSIYSPNKIDFEFINLKYEDTHE